MASRVGPPPLLLTKRLTAFLHLNLTSTITSLLLLTPDGKLLAYACNPPTPVTTLRTHATVAASLYAIHSVGTGPDTLDATLSSPSGAVHQRPRASRQQSQNNNDNDIPTPRPSPLAVTIQLESGIVLVIRRLQCGMLFACMGPGPESTTTSRPPTQHTSAAHMQPLAGAVTSGVPANGHNGQTPCTSPPPHAFGSPSEAASIRSAATGTTTASSVMFGAGTAGVMATRRHVEELARWLDDKLGPLDIPPNGFGGPA